jgi:hypothetical protein
MIFNQRPLQKMKASRQHIFKTIDKPALAPLPAHRYEFSQWKKATVNIDYHVEVDQGHGSNSGLHSLAIFFETVFRGGEMRGEFTFSENKKRTHNFL